MDWIDRVDGLLIVVLLALLIYQISRLIEKTQQVAAELATARWESNHRIKMLESELLRGREPQGEQ
jgi:hypothetical protein